jgi:carbonic anhydrase/acetyltransferase-like protein (isoleucine patch superfamily)
MPIYELDGQRPELPADERYWVADFAAVIGTVRLKRDVSVWYGSTLRGDNEWIEVGEGSNVQENCLLHTDIGFPLTVGAGCTIGHAVILHGCTIADNSLIGMGAMVTENKEFPDNSVIVGAPARLVRPVDDKILQLIAESAQFYVNNWQRYRKGLKRIG